jgi:FtsZ-binding cell division protein ZapB
MNKTEAWIIPQTFYRNQQVTKLKLEHGSDLKENDSVKRERDNAKQELDIVKKEKDTIKEEKKLLQDLLQAGVGLIFLIVNGYVLFYGWTAIRPWILSKYYYYYYY